MAEVCSAKGDRPARKSVHGSHEAAPDIAVRGERRPGRERVRPAGCRREKVLSAPARWREGQAGGNRSLDPRVGQCERAKAITCSLCRFFRSNRLVSQVAERLFAILPHLQNSRAASILVAGMLKTTEVRIARKARGRQRFTAPFPNRTRRTFSPRDRFSNHAYDHGGDGEGDQPPSRRAHLARRQLAPHRRHLRPRGKPAHCARARARRPPRRLRPRAYPTLHQAPPAPKCGGDTTTRALRCLRATRHPGAARASASDGSAHLCPPDMRARPDPAPSLLPSSPAPRSSSRSSSSR